MKENNITKTPKSMNPQAVLKTIILADSIVSMHESIINI